MFAPPYLHYPETNSSHFVLRRPGIADVKALFFFEGIGAERFHDEQSARASIHTMIRKYQLGLAIHWLVYSRSGLNLLGGFYLDGDFGSGKCNLVVDFWSSISDETQALELMNLVKKMCFQHLQMHLMVLNADLPNDWREALGKIAGFEPINPKLGLPVWVK
jgi:hypothetical protein